MQRLNDERGAIAVIVAVSMIMMFGFAALVIDVGALYQERRELQNGADAAALAIATECAEGALTCATGTAAELSPELGIGRSYANENALDDTTEVDSVVFGAQKVTVRTSTKVPGGGTKILYKLAGVLDSDFVGDTVGAAATATWGWVGVLRNGFPIVLSACEYEHHTANGTVFAEAPYTGDPVIVDLHTGNASGSTACPTGPAGMDVNDDGEVLPAGFSWLENVDCKVTTTAVGDVDWVTKDSGNNPECDDAELDPLLGTIIDLPVFGDFCRGNEPDPPCPSFNNRDKYEILTYTGFYLTGYKFPGGTNAASGWSNPSCGGPGGSGSCLAGYFVQHVASGGTTGGNHAGGLTAVSLIG